MGQSTEQNRNRVPAGSSRVEASSLQAVVASMLEAVGASEEDSELVASLLVDADLAGVASHGVQLLPMYVDRILAGSVDPTAHAVVVMDADAIAVLDCQNGLGHVTATQAMRIAAEKAEAYGIGLLAARNAFHFGMASHFTVMAAEEGKIGIASSNTRSLMPAPGGTERLVGNNPISIALPSADESPLVLDIALSEATMGKIRLAAASGLSIPPTWATDEGGEPTTDPVAAIAGMLLPAGGHKGFGFALTIDLLCGLLSGGGYGDSVNPLYGDLSLPYNSSQLFMAIDVERFRPLTDFQKAVADAADRVRSSGRRPDVSHIYVPGDQKMLRRREANGIVEIDQATLLSLSATAEKVGVDWTIASH